MKTSSMKISKDLLVKIKKLKEVEGVSTYEKLLEDLVNERIKSTHAVTYSDYLSVGTVVEVEDKTVVIETVNSKYVNFSDGSWVFNESVACKKIKKLANTVEEFEGVISC